MRKEAFTYLEDTNNNVLEPFDNNILHKYELLDACQKQKKLDRKKMSGMVAVRFYAAVFPKFYPLKNQIGKK